MSCQLDGHFAGFGVLRIGVGGAGSDIGDNLLLFISVPTPLCLTRAREVSRCFAHGHNGIKQHWVSSMFFIKSIQHYPPPFVTITH